MCISIERYPKKILLIGAVEIGVFVNAGESGLDRRCLFENENDWRHSPAAKAHLKEALST